MLYRQILVLIMLLSAAHLSSGGRRRTQTRDTKEMTYQGTNRDSEYLAAYKRAANMVQNNITPKDPCYGSDGKARKCDVSEFENVAIGKHVSSTSTCGTPPEKFCRKTIDMYGRHITQCSLCDANHNSRKQPPEYAVDSQNGTCWMSGLFTDPNLMRNVNFTISLEKTYELTYIILNFCNQIPESLALYKSSDNGRSWRPLQYYSSNCPETYGMEENEVITRENEQKAICNNVYNPRSDSTNSRVAFSFHVGRPSAPNLEDSPILRDWVTVTDIKLEFRRLQKPDQRERKNRRVEFGETIKSFYSLSEVVLGGRCKCNGHANGCKKDEEDKTVCDCKHNTAGVDCEKCASFYVDRPWSPATNDNANECVACECNGHSKRCEFSAERYQMTGQTSGGICLNCRHNTAGPQCQYCANGYHRNMLVPITSRQACIVCNCHALGSVGSTCSETGHCVCKEGVTGMKCTECKEGYIMTRSVTNPCEKIPKRERDNLIVEPGRKDATPSTSGNSQDKNSRVCGKCRKNSQILNQNKYCSSYYIIVAKVTRREKVNSTWTKFAIELLRTFKVEPAYSRNRRSTQYVYVRRNDLKCKCPRIRLGKTYLMAGVTPQLEEDGNIDGYQLDRDSFVVRHRNEYENRIKEFAQAERLQSCFRIMV